MGPLVTGILTAALNYVLKGALGYVAAGSTALEKLTASLLQTDWAKSMEQRLVDGGTAELSKVYDECVVWVKAHPAVAEFIAAVKPPEPIDLGTFSPEEEQAIAARKADGSLLSRLQ